MFRMVGKVLVWWAASSLLSGCYYLQAARGQLGVLVKRQPIAAVVADARTDSVLRQHLQQAQAARAFAVTHLGLPDNGSYTRYVQLPHAYVVWNVMAAAEFSVLPQRWCYPIAGCVTYRGYFHQAAAERFARHLRTRGFDAIVSGVPAYSTLGHFDDPLLSSMLRWGDAEVAATIFHELAHQVVYVSGNAAFNEAFATVVERTGLERWLLAQEKAQQWQQWQVQEQRELEVNVLLRQARDELKQLYASQSAPRLMRERKQQRLGKLKAEYQQLKQRWAAQGRSSNGYDHWFARSLSNADFVALSTYEDCVPAFEQLLQAQQLDLPRFYAAVRQLANSPARKTFCTSLEASDN